MGRMNTEEDYTGCWNNGAVGSNADSGLLNVNSLKFRLNTVLYLRTWFGFKSLPLHLLAEF